jgi:hypothetical protein
MKTRIAALFLLTLAGLSSSGQDPAASPGWKAGASSAVITPETLMWMAGYASRKEPAEGVETDLFAKALVLEDAEGGRVALVTADLVSVPRSVRLATAEAVQKAHGIPPERLLINVSHTHCGPEMRIWRAWHSDDVEKREREAEAYCAFLKKTFTRLVGEALANRVGASTHYVHSKCGFAMNRRRPDGKGGFSNAPNPDGPVDHRVPVLQVRSTTGDRNLAIVFGYACHCTTLGHQKFNGDYAGYAQTEIERAHPGATALFVNGCSGDQNPYPRREVAYAEAHGRSLALAVETALQTPPRELAGPIRAAMREIPLKFATLPTRDELEVRAKSADKLDATLAQHLLGELDAGRALPVDYPYPVQVIRLGNELTLVALGGEVVVDYSLRLQKEIRDPVVWVAGYSNDVMTYIPSRRIWEEGGYEGGDAMKWNLFPARWHPEVEEVVVRAVHELRATLD